MNNLHDIAEARPLPSTSLSKPLSHHTVVMFAEEERQQAVRDKAWEDREAEEEKHKAEKRMWWTGLTAEEKEKHAERTSLTKQVKAKLTKLKVKLTEKGGHELIYDMNERTFKPIVVGTTEKQVLTEINKIVLENPSMIEGSKLVIVSISCFVSSVGVSKKSLGPGVGGALSISAHVLTFSHSNRVITSSNQPGQRLWFTDEQILTYNITSELLRHFVICVMENKIYNKGLAMFYIDKMDKFYSQPTSKRMGMPVTVIVNRMGEDTKVEEWEQISREPMDHLIFDCWLSRDD